MQFKFVISVLFGFKDILMRDLRAEIYKESKNPNNPDMIIQ